MAGTLRIQKQSITEMDVTIAVIDDNALQLGTSILSQAAGTKSESNSGFQFF